MKFTLSWLKEHLDTDAPAATIADTLTMVGLEMEALVDRAAALRDVVVARIVEARAHPNADKLKLCTVDTGSATVEVVCGAPNARTGMIGAFAPEGATLPGLDGPLRKAKIRGAESSGMLLSEREMGLSDEHSGIVELPEGAPVGTPAATVMGLDDPLFDVAITPNRGDCLGVRGIARDLAAAGLGRLKPLALEPVPGTFPSPIGVSLRLESDVAGACPYFVGRYIRGVRNGPSPKWLQDRLLSVGLRPISALVDMTNYLTVGLNRPLHAFDADLVRGDIQVRLAREGESLDALNDRSYELGPAMTVIADDHDAEALGGVIGGERTGCTESTVNVFLESALFDPVRTAATGRELGILSDARYRFERGIDPAFLVDGMEIATRLVLDLCGGEPSELVIAGGEPDWRRTVPLRPSRLASLGGVGVDEATARTILEDLGFTVDGSGEVLEVGVPSWRGDVVGEACLVEEVLRIHGYDHIPVVPLERTTTLPTPAVAAEQRRHAAARRLLAARGLNETVTFSFVSGDDARMFGATDDKLRLINPISADLDVMRPSVLPHLVAACGRNADRGLTDAGLFEVGPQYAGPRPEHQEIVAAGVRSGRTGSRHWAAAPRPVDAFDAKADALALLGALGIADGAVQTRAEAPGWYHPGRSGCLALGPQRILAYFGELHPRVLQHLDVKGPAAAFEVFIDRIPPRKAGAARPPLQASPYQAVGRDFAFVVADTVDAEAVVRAVRGADKGLIADVRVFDVFAGQTLGPSRTSLAVNVILQPTDKTLTDAEIDAVAARIVAAVEKATGGVLRT